jgi:hypothetical protein
MFQEQLFFGFCIANSLDVDREDMGCINVDEEEVVAVEVSKPKGSAYEKSPLICW